MELHCGTCKAGCEPGNEYCGTCGAWLIAQSPQEAIVPSLSPPPLAETRHPVRNAIFRIAGVLFAGAATVCVAVLLWPRPDPLQTIEEIRTSYEDHDVASFEEQVDIESVLTGVVTDAVNILSVSDYSPTYRMITAIPRYLVVQKLKSAVVPELAEATREIVSGGSLSTSIPADELGMSPELSELLSEVISEDLSFQSAQLISKSGTSAIVEVTVVSKLTGRPIVARLRLKPAGNHWKVVSIDNVADIIEQVTDDH